MTDYCICGHSDWEHNFNEPAKAPYCNGCVYAIGSFENKTWHEFKLDNLKLVEDLAKEKGLI